MREVSSRAAAAACLSARFAVRRPGHRGQSVVATVRPEGWVGGDGDVTAGGAATPQGEEPIDDRCIASSQIELSRDYRQGVRSAEHTDAGGGRPQVGDADLSVIGAALADKGRCKILLALADGRSLPASVLAGEAGVSAATASTHLRKLCDVGLLHVVRKGRWRYFRLAGDEVGQLIETLARLSPTQPIRSLREGTRAHAIRLARCCYNHIAGRLGVAITGALIDHRYLTGHDGSIDLDRLRGDRLAGGLLDQVTYQLSEPGRGALRHLGVTPPDDDTVRCCVDWTEQSHHVAGPLGRALLDGLTATGWIRPAPRSRALLITDEGKRGLRDHLGLTWPPPARAFTTR